MAMRVLVRGLPRLLEDAVAAILSADPDLVVVFLDDDDDIAAAVLRQRADAVLLHGSYITKGRDPAFLLADGCGARVLILADQGGALYLLGEQLVLRRRPSAAQLLRAVRGEFPPDRESRMSVGPRRAQ